MNDDKLQEMAVKELLQEAKRGKERSQTMGPRGWRKNVIPYANKQFLQRTITSSLIRSKPVLHESLKSKRKESSTQSRRPNPSPSVIDKRKQDKKDSDCEESHLKSSEKKRKTSGNSNIPAEKMKKK